MENTEATTNNFLNWVEIKNFKSIKDLRLDCKRVNVFIGKPNVGKSNILEGLGLLGAEYSIDKFLNGFIRYKEIKHLFYDNDWEKKIQIYSDKITALIGSSVKVSVDFEYYSYPKYIPGIDTPNVRDVVLDSGGTLYELKYTGEMKDIQRAYRYNSSPYKKYDFANLDAFRGVFKEFLLPPDGHNLFGVVDKSSNLKTEFGKLFSQQGLDFVLSRDEQMFELQRKDGFYVIKYPFFSIADTFRRFMFYITAIESNKNSVIIFEEPEVHSFPPYTQDIAYRMIYSEENQFFVSTHSPYLLQTLVSNLADDQLNVFVTYYEDYETKVKALTPEELGFVQEYSTDVFFNLDRFIPNARSANPA
ncbi:AAA family ATPase [Fibrisoma limi]|nr:AAA family ATPase [Fibrisoma limi]